ncbi:MAG: tetratricopeptide repeat protein [Cyclobacteriaceae bacterium]
MVRIIFFILWGILFFVNDANSQNQKIVDSLQAVLETRTGGERFPALYELTFEYVYVDLLTALAFIQQAEDAALISADTLWIVKSKRVKGYILYALERIPEAIESLNAALPIAIRNNLSTETIYIQETLGKLNLYVGNYDKALMFHVKNLDLATRLRDNASMCLAFHGVGISYYKLKNYNKALEFLKKSYRIRHYIETPTFWILANMSLCYANLRDFKNARLFVENSLNECGKNCSEKSRINIEYTFAFISLGENQPILAEDHFLTSYTLSKKSNDTRFQLDNIYLLSEIYIERKEFKKAEFYLLEAQKLIKPNTPFNLEMIKIYSRFSEFYLAMKNFEKASFYQSKYISLKDHIYNEEFTASLMKTEAEYLERENRAKIVAQQQAILLKEQIINRQWYLNVVTSLLGLITITFLIFLMRIYKKKKNLNIVLDSRVKERTLELEASRSELLTVLKRQELLIGHASFAIAEKVNTIKGLCLIGSKEVSDPVSLNYIDKINRTSCQLSSYLASVFL